MKITNVALIALLFSSLALVACKAEPTCQPGEVPQAFKGDSLSKVVPLGEDVTVCADSDGNHVRFWRPVKVHRANMDAVGNAQDNGFSRLSDNWHGTEGNFHTPKWSELQNEAGNLRIDVKESGDGSQIDLKFAPTS